MGIVVERSSSACLSPRREITLGCFAADCPIQMLSNRHSVLSALLWSLALRGSQQLNMFSARITAYSAITHSSCCQGYCLVNVIASRLHCCAGLLHSDTDALRTDGIIVTTDCYSSYIIRRGRSFLPASAISLFDYICRADYIFIRLLPESSFSKPCYHGKPCSLYGFHIMVFPRSEPSPAFNRYSCCRIETYTLIRFRTRRQVSLPH